MVGTIYYILKSIMDESTTDSFKYSFVKKVQCFMSCPLSLVIGHYPCCNLVDRLIQSSF